MRNIQLENLIGKLKEKARLDNAPFWRRIADELERPGRQKRVVNLFKLESFTKENEFVIVPGKVLATGELNHKLTVAAFSFSGSAKEKIEKLKGTALSIEDLIKMNPKGQDVKIVG
jgi:large subunit ribosomal protein L18e